MSTKYQSCWGTAWVMTWHGRANTDTKPQSFGLWQLQQAWQSPCARLSTPASPHKGAGQMSWFNSLQTGEEDTESSILQTDFYDAELFHCLSCSNFEHTSAKKAQLLRWNWCIYWVSGQILYYWNWTVVNGAQLMEREKRGFHKGAAGLAAEERKYW